MLQTNNGFTLIELLIVISILSILIASVFITLNPSELFASARNARRWMEIDSIAKAIRIYELKGAILQIDSDYGRVQVLGTATFGCDTTCGARPSVSSCLDLSGILIGFLPEIPQDPKTGAPENTDYFVNRTNLGVLEVGVCDPELGVKIYVTR